ncbi:hypothetical protein [Sphingomonas sp. R1]|uniref:hypothetical protein n=1 Tax=Sphingomonas sp. R1 TaxID=399176 RepID=UPI002225181F|nr:hypothetical protein [Sphingomonas sp. R1]UYY79579.1 hypothetical protein OIM94_19900 [Sphingomonas sp. R1]
MHDTSSPRFPLLNGWRITGWGCLLALFMLPALAMQITSEVDWTTGDFVFAAVALGLLGATVELAVHFSRPGAARTGYILAGFIAFLTIWSNAAVGIVGDEDSINILFFMMIAVALVAGAFLRFRSSSMRWITVALAIGQYAAGVAALFVMPRHAVEWGVLTFFAVLWLTASWCFRCATSPRSA